MVGRRYESIMFIMLITSVVAGLSVGVAEAEMLTYTVDVYWVDTNDMFYTYGPYTDIYILKEEYVYRDNFVTIQEQIYTIQKDLIYWNLSKYPELQPLSLNSCIGRYECGYFLEGLMREMRSYIMDLGYKEFVVRIGFNIVTISVGDGENPTKLLNNAEKLVEIHKKWIKKLLGALYEEGLHIPLSDFLEAINHKVNVVVITTPFQRETFGLKIDDSIENMLKYQESFERFGFVIQHITVEFWMGVYSMEIPLACTYPELGINYSYSSIEEVFDGVIEAKNLIFGKDRVVIIIPSKKCYVGDPFQSDSSSAGGEDISIELPIDPVKVKSLVATIDADVYNGASSSNDPVSKVVDRNELSTDSSGLDNESQKPAIYDTYSFLLLSIMALISVLSLTAIVKRVSS